MRTDRGGIIGWFARNPVAANLLMILVILAGVFSAGDLRKEAFPSLEPNSITVSVSYDSGSAQQSEEGLAIKIEDQLEGVTGIDSITSSSTGSGVTVTIEKQSDYDLDTLLTDVKTKVDAISTFPADAKNPVIQKAEREEHSLWLQLYGDADRHTLQRLADELKSDLMATPEISRVTISGWLDPMMVVEIDEGRLQAYGLSLSDVEEAVNAGSSNTMTAVLRDRDLYLQLKASEQAYRVEEFAAIPLITAADGREIRLGDVTRIRDAYDDLTSSLLRYQGRDSIGLQVVTTGQDDIIDTVNAARRVADAWQTSGDLPKGVELATWYDRSESIQGRLELLVRNALTGILLVFVLLAAFLDLTLAFWVAMGLPFIFFGTLYFMGDGFMGLSLNAFTTFGFIMALGIVVDDAVVVGESVYTLRSERGDTLGNTIRGTLRVAVPTLFGVFTTVAAFYALSQIQGHLGELYAQFADVVAICLILSIVESKLILPAHLAHLKTHRRPTRNPLLRGWQWVQRGADLGLTLFRDRLYRPLLEQALIHRYATVLVFLTVLVLVISMPFTGAVRLSFFPDIVGDTVRAQVAMRNDASFGQTHRALDRLESLAYAIDRELRGNADQSGIANLQVLSSGDQSGTVTVELRAEPPYDIRVFTKRWREAAGLPEGVRTLNVQSFRRMVSALRVELRANDDEVLTLAGEALKAHLERIPAVFGIEDNLEPGQPQLRLELTQQGRALGMTTSALAVQVLQSFSGQVVQRYQRDSDEIEVKVRYPEIDRQSAADVLQARVRTPDGSVVPLASVATLTFGYTRDTITRIDGKRAVYISSDVDKEQLSATELVAQLQADVAPRLERQYPGLDIHFAGEAEEQAETQASMTQMFMLALLLIYLLLAIPLGSYVQPLLIMTAIPFGIVGAILGHWVNGLSLGILSLNGIIALSGVVVNDSLLLTARFNELHKRADDVREAAAHAGLDRLRAVLLTSFTTFAGLVPLLGETSLQAQFLIPAAVSLGYGIMFATFITLIFIPALLLIQQDVAGLIGRLRRRLLSRPKEEEQPC
ncbi:efflux RND transporter permease subunit [Imhoffiella purpurea]|uniref:Acriflavin resistance protein n=1 Tax=Imhoffiella purpurea TaxID=1249627 RepID=W9UZY7_9GAMM|nr:efflux RND transporter permease subunit [Imhoffiella purpurea]EXJ12649.1 Acriflavin resistance protein [Imhoffiella purpurea]